MIRSLVLMLMLGSLGACAAIDKGLSDQANPRYHPFPTYASGGGGSR